MSSNAADIGTVWNYFTYADNEFMLRPVRENHLDDALRLILHVLLDDSMVEALGFRHDKISMKSLVSFVKAHLKANLTFGCYLGRTDKLIGVDVIYVRKFNDKDYSYGPDSGEAFRKYIKYKKFVQRRLRYNANGRNGNPKKYLSSLGMFILPECRHTNIKTRDTSIEQQMLHIRTKLALALGIVLNGAALIGNVIQSVAEKSKYNVIEEITDNNAEQKGLEYLKGAAVFPIKIMKKIELGPRSKAEIPHRSNIKN